MAACITSRRACFRGVLFLAILTWFPNDTNARMSNQSALLQRLLDDYGPPTVRPVYNASEKITVVFRLIITQVIELNELQQTIQISGWLRQTWKDEFLRWNSTEHEDVEELYIDRTKIWLPDTTLYKNVDKDFESYKDISVQVGHDGVVSWATPVILKCTCRIDARLFPFDTQICELKFSSWAFDGSKVDLVQLQGDQALQNQYADDGVWALLKVDVIREEQFYACCANPYPEVSYFLHLQRRPLFHILNILVPCVLLSILNLMVFALPPESGEKIQLGMTNLLALVLFQQLISGSLPPTSDNSPIIGFYFTPMIAIGCSSIICTVLVLYLFYRNNRRPVPAWMAMLVRGVARAVFYDIRPRNRNGSSSSGAVNQAFCLDGDAVPNRRVNDGESSGVLTASCSFTNSSRSVNGNNSNGGAETADVNHREQTLGNSRARCRAYSMHITEEVYSTDKVGADQPSTDKSTAVGPQNLPLPTRANVEWTDAALVIDRVTMILSVVITLCAMTVTCILFATEMNI